MTGTPRVLAKPSVIVARALRPIPAALEWYLRKAKDYVDWRCKEGVTCRTHFGAVLKCLLPDMIQRKIAYFGVWEPNLTAYIKRSLGPGDVIADVGANIGYYSLLGAALVGKNGRVIAIEASPIIFKALSENLAVNSAQNVRAINNAASYETGEMPVFMAPSDNIGRSSTIPVEGNVLTGTIPAKPLHEILTRDEMSRCRLIKIDIEGAEPPVVRSILENIALYSSNCEIAVEVSIENTALLDDFTRAGFYPYFMENNYSDAPYVRQKVTAPVRFTGKIVAQSDFVFSRADRDFL